MSDSYTIAKLAEHIGAEVHGDAGCEIKGVASLAAAKAGDLSFFLGAAYRRFLSETCASAVVLTADDLPNCSVNAIVTKNPELGFAKLLALFEKKPGVHTGRHPTAIIGDACQIDSSVSIGAYCVVGDNVFIGPNTIISAGCHIGDGVRIGADCYCYPNVTLYHRSNLGNHVIVHSGVVIGSDGFGLTNDNGQWVKIPQVGTVIIRDNVEIGANTTIDRGALEDTVIDEGVKLDNQVLVAHNVRIGAHTVIAGCTGIAGSAQIGKHCIIGGGARINSHITITDQVIITGMCMVTHSISKPGAYSSGTGLQENRQWHKSVVRFRQLDKLAKRIKHLESLHHE